MKIFALLLKAHIYIYIHYLIKLMLLYHTGLFLSFRQRSKKISTISARLKTRVFRKNILFIRDSDGKQTFDLKLVTELTVEHKINIFVVIGANTT